MILYSSPSSYYSMIGRLALFESAISFELRPMDIHFKKEQLAPWYVAINPAMTVPTLTNGDAKWLSSQAILEYAAQQPKSHWLDNNKTLQANIQQLVQQHYALSIEQLTFGKLMQSFFPLRHLFPKVLSGIVQQLEKELTNSKDPAALQHKININQQRLKYFQTGDQQQKLHARRQEVRAYIDNLPTPKQFLFGDQISSCDIVTAVLFSRLKMIHEFDLVTKDSLKNWFEQMRQRPQYQTADIWMRFHPWRLLSNIF